ncbi:MAG: DinB family protein [Bryobacteraceae bacterium]|nr:DinB family protein [Bryobacteraceae bacterium]
MSTSAMAEQQALIRTMAERWEQVARKFAELAEQIPEDKFEWTPMAGLRTCGAVVRHVAFWNLYVGSSLRGVEADDSANELSVLDYPTREKALDALTESAEAVGAALRQPEAELTPRTLDLVAAFAEHTSEHYGQLTVYARTMGVVPPASRG